MNQIWNICPIEDINDISYEQYQYIMYILTRERKRMDKIMGKVLQGYPLKS